MSQNLDRIINIVQTMQLIPSISPISLFPPNVTPKSWVTVGHHMIRLRTYTLSYDQIVDAVTPFIRDGWFKLAVRTDADGVPAGYSALLLECESDMDRIRENNLVALVPNPVELEGKPIASAILKIKKFIRHPGCDPYTIKTTAPSWATKAMFKAIFSQYSSDHDKYNLIIDGEYCPGTIFPIVRTYPLYVMRHGVKTLANVVYIEYSPTPGHEDDALVAQTMQYRSTIVNPLNPEESASLIFNPWIFDKDEAKLSRLGKKYLYEEKQRQKSLETKIVETVSSKADQSESRIIDLGFPSPFEIPLLK